MKLRMNRYLPHAMTATVFVIVLPALAVSALVPSGSAAWLLVSVPLAIVLSVAAASCGAAFWMRRPGSKDLVFADLMLWGWLRRYRAERRLAEARAVFGRDAKGLNADQRIAALTRLSTLLDARDADTHRHSRRVTRHAERIAGRMRLSAAEVAKIRTAAALHDVGKLHTPMAILQKPGRLTEAEYAVIKRHPADGADMLSGIEDREITAMVRHHHERVDGTGYPDGLTGADIPLGARIIAVADTFDAITSDRFYRATSRHKRALDILAKEAGAQLDPAAVSAFLGYYSGRRSVAWSALVAAAPQRFLAWLGTTTQGFAPGVPSLAVTVPAVGAALLLTPNTAPPSPLDADASRPPRSLSSGPSSAARSDASRSTLRLASELGRSDARPGRVSPVRVRRPVSHVRSPGAARTPAPDGGDTGAQSPAPGGAGLPPIAAPPAVDLPPVKVPPVDISPLRVPTVTLPAVKLPPIELPELPVG